MWKVSCFLGAPGLFQRESDLGSATWHTACCWKHTGLAQNWLPPHSTAQNFRSHFWEQKCPCGQRKHRLSHCRLLQQLGTEWYSESLHERKNSTPLSQSFSGREAHRWTTLKEHGRGYRTGKLDPQSRRRFKWGRLEWPRNSLEIRESGHPPSWSKKLGVDGKINLHGRTIWQKLSWGRWRF